MHSFRLHGAGISRGVTVHTHGFGAGSDHFVGGSLDCVITVAGDTTRESHRGERVLVRAGLEQLRLEDVAIRADIGDVGDPRGCGSVVAMEVVQVGALRSPRTTMASWCTLCS